MSEVLLRNPFPGVAYLESDPIVGGLDIQENATAFGKLDGVTYQVVEHLLQTDWVCCDVVRDRTSQRYREPKIFLACAHLKLVDQRAQEPAQVDGVQARFHRTGLDLREIKDFVDHLQQMFATGEYGPQFVTHICQEDALRAISGLCCLLGLTQSVFALPKLFGSQVDQRNQFALPQLHLPQTPPDQQKNHDGCRQQVGSIGPGRAIPGSLDCDWQGKLPALNSVMILGPDSKRVMPFAQCT